MVVKKILILSVSRKDSILIDYACGKAGDLPKWTRADLRFVLGIDRAKMRLYDVEHTAQDLVDANQEDYSGRSNIFPQKMDFKRKENKFKGLKV